MFDSVEACEAFDGVLRTSDFAPTDPILFDELENVFRRLPADFPSVFAVDVIESMRERREIALRHCFMHAREDTPQTSRKCTSALLWAEQREHAERRLEEDCMKSSSTTSIPTARKPTSTDDSFLIFALRVLFCLMLWNEGRFRNGEPGVMGGLNAKVGG